MNQILDYGAGNNDNSGKSKKNSNFSGGGNFGGGNNNKYNNGGGNKSPMSDKVVKVFAVIMIVLAIALIASGAMSLLKNKKDVTETKAKSEATQTPVQAEILAELNDITGKIKITINSQVPISKVIYVWDQGSDHVESGEKKTTFEKEIFAQYGQHVLHIQVTDEKNNKTIKDFEFDSVTGIDTIQPEIKLEVTPEKTLRITATDDTAIAYVTYTWTNEETGESTETVTMTPEEENSQEYSFDIEIPDGKNSIAVFAIDGGDPANVTSTTKVLEGVRLPEVVPTFIDGTKKIQFTFTHEKGIKEIYIEFNGQAYEWKDEPQTELQFAFDSIPGHNEMYMVITSVDDTVKEWRPTWENPVEEDQGGEVNYGTDEEANTGDDSETNVGSGN